VQNGIIICLQSGIIWRNITQCKILIIITTGKIFFDFKPDNVYIVYT